MDIEMPAMNFNLRPVHRLLFGILCAVFFVMSVSVLPAAAQVVVVANGSPITELDIQQRTKLVATSSHKNPSRQEIINELIDDRIKIAKGKVYGLEASDTEVDQAFENMARRQSITPQQFSQMLERSGISPGAIKARVRAEIVWNQLVRGKFNSSLQIGESDIANALKARNEAETKVGYTYTLYPVTLVAERGEGGMDARRRDAENLRGRFTSCAEGLPMVRALRNVAVREAVRRSSSELPAQLRDVLGNMEVGRLTTPEVTPQGLQMFALCDKKESTADSPVKREVREDLFNKRFEAEARKFLDEVRKQAMIEYKK
jgi:peptidyl-prolyl cis-trans isomerase SurA